MRSRNMQNRFGKWLLTLVLALPLFMTCNAMADDEVYRTLEPTPPTIEEDGENEEVAA